MIKKVIKKYELALKKNLLTFMLAFPDTEYSSPCQFNDIKVNNQINTLTHH